MFLYTRFSAEEANKRMANCRISALPGTGHVPLGEQTWNCHRNNSWHDNPFTITPLTAAEFESAEASEVEGLASMRAAMFEQAHGVRCALILYFG
eukprot:SAG31_NODE_1363_length_8627_cov_5.967402_4_plen_95_part_00